MQSFRLKCKFTFRSVFVNRSALVITVLLAVCGTADAEKQLLWGDTHLHSKYSPDAYMLGNTSVTPDQAYRFAKGIPIVNARTRHKIQIGTPLDFLVVSDHAEYMGIVPKLFEGDAVLGETDSGKEFINLVKQGKTREAFLQLVATANNRQADPDFNSERIRRSVWSEITKVADQHYQPGTFTTFIGWEWSSLTNGANLHRIVFQKQGREVADQYLPFSLFDSDRPEDLWSWMDATAKQTGADFIAIPHNSNLSNGTMFSSLDSNGEPISADYAATRLRWEPIVEITQIKGDSETSAALSPNDEFAEFESYRRLLDARPGADMTASESPADYVRTALMQGLEIENAVAANPYQFGVIGSSDSHSGVSAVEEDNFGGKFPLDSFPEGKSAALTPGVMGNDMSSSGLAAVWAEENTRDAIFDAFSRKEVYATTGPRIMLRVFAGWDFDSEDLDSADIATLGYQRGVPMGGTLLKPTNANNRTSLKLVIQTAKDPVGANLDRVQVVKLWLDEDGKAREKVFNVMASDNRKIIENQVAPVGNTVDVQTTLYANSIGSSQLDVVWQDPQFNLEQAASYYVRVLQIPTPRHSLYAAVALQEANPEGYPATIQERAYSSPIWYAPE